MVKHAGAISWRHLYTSVYNLYSILCGISSQCRLSLIVGVILSYFVGELVTTLPSVEPIVENE